MNKGELHEQRANMKVGKFIEEKSKSSFRKGGVPNGLPQSSRGRGFYRSLEENGMFFSVI
jgi:hypothetical protein